MTLHTVARALQGPLSVAYRECYGLESGQPRA
jgi:hypothetical protein